MNTTTATTNNINMAEQLKACKVAHINAIEDAKTACMNSRNSFCEAILAEAMEVFKTGNKLYSIEIHKFNDFYKKAFETTGGICTTEAKTMLKAYLSELPNEIDVPKIEIASGTLYIMCGHWSQK